MEGTRRRRESSPLSSTEGDPRFLPLEVRAPTPDARCLEASLSSLDEEITPTNRFFIRSHFAVPRIDPANWRLVIDGEVERPLTLTLADLQELPHRDLTSVLECAGNSRVSVRPKAEGVLWGHGAVSAARWRGVPLRAVLETAGVRPSAIEAVMEGADSGHEPGVADELRYAMSIFVGKAFDEHTLLVDQMNGEPLSASHGFPVRAIVPGWYGMASVKWLTRIIVTEKPFQGYFRSRAYAYIREGESSDAPKPPVTSVRVKSLVTWPKEGQVLAPGPHRLRGVAWSGEASILRVDVSTSPETGSGAVLEAGSSVARVDPVLLEPLGVSLRYPPVGILRPPRPGHGREWELSARAGRMELPRGREQLDPLRTHRGPPRRTPGHGLAGSPGRPGASATG